MKYAHIARWFTASAWAVLPEKLAVMVDTLAYLMAGGQFSDEEILQRVGAAPKPARRVTGDIAVLPLLGVISHRADMLGESSGGTSVEAFTARFRQALADPAIGAIILDVDSPGGNVEGVDELASEIYQAREVKPVVAVANATAASAAYWLASAAGEFSVTPSGEVGSIGVWTAHMDESAALEKMGIRPTLVTAGKYKAELSPFMALTEEARAALQDRVDESYGMFVAAIARNRGVSAADVRGGFGEGRMVGAKKARQMGMVDRVETLDQAIERLRGKGGGSRRGSSVALERQRLELASI